MDVLHWEREKEKAENYLRNYGDILIFKVEDKYIGISEWSSDTAIKGLGHAELTNIFLVKPAIGWSQVLSPFSSYYLC